MTLLQKCKRWLSIGLCAALAAAVACMAVAVLVQALAVLIIALLAAALLLPHPPKWYAKEGAEAVRLFVHEVFTAPKREEDGTPSTLTPAEMQDSASADQR